VPPPSVSERLAIAALALAAFALNLNTNVLAALLPFLRDELTLVPVQMKVLIAAAAFGSAAGALLFDRLARLGGRRQVMVAALAVFAGASALHVVPGPFGWLLALRALAALAVGVAYAAASVLVAEIAPYSRRGAAMGRFNAGMFLAIPLGLPFAAWCAEHGAWQAVFALQAVVAALGIWWALRTIPAGTPDATRGPLLAVLANRGALAGLAATALHVGSFFTTVTLASTWLDETGVVPRGEQERLWVVLGVASVLGSALLGRLADRVGKRNFVLVTSAVLVGCFWYLAREPGAWGLAAAGLVLALVAAARTGPLQALVSGQVRPAQLDSLMSWRGCVMQLGVGGFALAAAPVADRLGFRGVLYLAAGCQLLSYLVIRWGCREGR
jgi:DHA1 family inner membrane transport protein